MANLPIYAPSSQPMNEMFIRALIKKDAVEDFVVTMFPQLNVFNTIAKKYQAPKERVTRRQYQMERIGNTYVAATITTQSLVNGQMVLGLDQNYDAFRIDDGVKALSGTEGVVARKEPGKIWLDFHASPTGATSFDSGTDFLVGETASSRGDYANVNNPDMRKERLVTEPSYFYNYVNLMREVASATGNEVWEDTFLGNVNGKPWQLDSQIQYAMLRASMDFAVRTYDGLGSATGGHVTADGFENQIKNGGGVIDPFTNQVTNASLNSFINKMAKNGGLNGNKLVASCGLDYLAGFQQNTAATLIQYPGKENTVGGADVVGINSFRYAFDGVEIELYVEPLFSNTNAYGLNPSTGLSKFSNGAFYFSPTPAVTNRGNRPWLVQKYYGKMDMIISDTNSILDENGNVREGLSNGQLEFQRLLIYQKTMQLVNPAAHGIHIGNN